MSVPTHGFEINSNVKVKPSTDDYYQKISQKEDEETPVKKDGKEFRISGVEETKEADDESVVLGADSSTVFREVSHEVEQPVNMRWTFGYNTNLPVINLNDGTRESIVYASSHVAVIYDYKQHKQIILQGHMNTVASMSCSGDKRWLVTCDKGPQSCIIIWDTYTGIPVQTLFDVVEDRGVICSVAFSHDAKYVAAITEHNYLPKILIWDWTVQSEAIKSLKLNIHYRGQANLHFHVEDPHLLVSNSEHQVIFYKWKEEKNLKYDAPTLNESTFNRSVGLFISSLFQLPPKDVCLTATSNGHVAVWSPIRAIEHKGIVRSHRRRPLKLVKLSSKAVTSLAQTHDGLVVIGDTIGQLRFYDTKLNLLFALKDLKLGSIKSVSFELCDDHDLNLVDNNHGYPEKTTIDRKPFISATFIVSTLSGQVVHYQPNGCVSTFIMNECQKSFDTIAASPNKSLLCIGSKGGLVKMWDYSQKKSIATRLFPKSNTIYSLTFNHDSLLLGVGLQSGEIYILDALSLTTESTQQLSRQPITKIKFSHDSKYLATADAGFSVTVFINAQGGKEWKCIGRYKSHYDVINDLVFGVDEEVGTPRLITLGKDRSLVEYDLLGTCNDILQLRSIHRIEQSAVPLSLEWLPPVLTESFLITSNNQHKMRLYNSTTKMCRYTFLSPTFGAPVAKIKVIPNLPGTDPSKHRLLCYATDTKIGVQLLPLDGSPHRSVAVIGHPGGISQVQCSYDGKYIFAANRNLSSVHMWSINRDALYSATLLGGDGLEPFYGLLEGGKDGPLIKEIENFFYYAQIRSQGENTMEVRKASDFIKLDQIPFVMRSLGFYPSEQEIEDMINEIKFKDYVKTSKYVDEIDLLDFIKLYINHRPAFGLSIDELANAFRTLNSRRDGDAVNRSYLLHILQQLGEHITHEEMAECLYSLLGKEVIEKIEVMQAEGDVKGDTDCSTEITHPAHFMPDELTLDYFIHHLLGLDASRGDSC